MPIKGRDIQDGSSDHQVSATRVFAKMVSETEDRAQKKAQEEILTMRRQLDVK